jgi:hypothetical protein
VAGGVMGELTERSERSEKLLLCPLLLAWWPPWAPKLELL